MKLVPNSSGRVCGAGRCWASEPRGFGSLLWLCWSRERQPRPRRLLLFILFSCKRHRSQTPSASAQIAPQAVPRGLLNPAFSLGSCPVPGCLPRVVLSPGSELPYSRTRGRKGVPDQGASHFHFIFSCLYFFFFLQTSLSLHHLAPRMAHRHCLHFFPIFLDMESLYQAAFSVMPWE